MQFTPQKPLKQFFKLIALEKRDVLRIYFLVAISGFITLSLPLGVQSIINLLFGGLISTSLIILILVVVLGVAMQGWLSILQLKLNENIQRRVFTRYSLQFAYKIPRLDLLSIDDYYLPELVNRFFDTAMLQKGLSKMLVEFPGALVQMVFGLLLLSFYHPIFIVFSALLLLAVGLILRYTYPQGIRSSIRESDIKYEVGYWLEEVARNIKSIKFMGKNEFPLHKADGIVSNYLDARAAHFNVLKIQYWTFVLFKVLVTACLLGLGVVLVLEQQLNVGQFIASEIIIILVLNAAEKIILNLDAVYDMLTSLEKVNKLLDKPVESENGVQVQSLSDDAPITIKADKLSYRFKAEGEPVLNNLTFEIAAGEKVCIFGSLGSGKTTLLKLLTGSYNNYEGQLLLNGYPLSDLHLTSVRKNIGVSSTTPDLFAGTLLENLTMGDSNITNRQILDMAEVTGLKAYILALRNGLNTEVKSAGKDFPRNIVRKIVLTRALLMGKGLVLLEDCWSDMELSEREKIVAELTSKNLAPTLVAVTNDENFARNCDKVMLLENGTVVEFGPYSEVSNSQEYKRLFKHLSI